MPMHDDKENMNNNEVGSFRDKKMGGKRATFKKKICKFCAQKLEPDYKNPQTLHYRARQDSSCPHHRNMREASEGSYTGD